MQVPSFLKQQADGSLSFEEKGTLIYYVPEVYFEREYAQVKGQYVNLLGIFDWARYDENGKCVEKVQRFYFPTVFLCKPCRMEKQKNVKLFEEASPNDYRLLIFEKGDIPVVGTDVPEDIANVEDFFKIFLISGKMSNTIPYDKLQEYFFDSIQLNGSDYGINAQMFGIVIGGLAKKRGDPTTPFRYTKMDNMHDYQFISIKDNPKYISPYSSLESENWDTALIGLTTLNDDSQAGSPMERLLMGFDEEG